MNTQTHFALDFHVAKQNAGVSHTGNQEQSDVEDHELHTLDNSGGSTSNAPTRSPQTLSNILLANGLRPPSVKARTNSLEPQVEFLYSSRFFKSIMWIIQAAILGLAISTFLDEGILVYALGGGFSDESWNAPSAMFLQGGSAENVLAGFFWLVGGLLFIVFIGSFFSKAFR